MTERKEKKERVGCIAYYRVSGDEQDFAGQKLCVLEYCQKHNFKIRQSVEYKVSSSKKRQARGIDDLVEIVSGKDSPKIVICSELSRFGRSVSEVLRLVEEFIREYACTFIFVKENLVLDKEESSRDISSHVMLTIFCLLADLEKKLIRQRVTEALNARRKAGVVLGRPKGESKLDSKEDEIKGMLTIGIKQTFIARKMDCTEATLSNWLKRKRKEWDTNET
jgi:DNA invertase Pin-like site-specific DNA recombinase